MRTVAFRPSSIPGYLIQVVPELKVNGEVKATGQAQTLGSDFWLSVTQQFVNRSPKSASAVYPSGSYYSLSTIGGSVSSTKLEQLQVSVTNTKTILESNDANLIKTLTGDKILGDMFYAGTMGYYAQHLAYTHLIAQPQGGHLSLFPSAGTYGYTPKVQFMFGLPMNLTPGGIQMDLFQENVTTQMNDGNLDKRVQFLLQTGVMGSALEHAVPEQMFNDPANPSQNTEAISAVKALQKAAAAGQKIYQITAANKATTLPNIHHDAGTMSDMNNALNAGKIVITHTDAVSVPGWTGSGYLILDPNIGDGAYKIGGGQSGSFYFGSVLGAAIADLLVFATIFLFMGQAEVAAIVAYQLLALLAVTLVAYTLIKSYSSDPIAPGCFLGGLVSGFSYAFGWASIAGYPLGVAGAIATGALFGAINNVVSAIGQLSSTAKSLEQCSTPIK